MELVRIVELIAGWLAVVTGAAIALFWWLGGFIAPQSVAIDLFVFGLILAVIAASVTVESLTGSLVARFTLTLGTLALVGVYTISFLVELSVPALLALAAALIAFTRHLSAPRSGRTVAP